MTITIKITTGGLTEIGKSFTYHIFEEKDIKRVSNKLKKIVAKYPPKKDLYDVGQEVRYNLKTYDSDGNEIEDEGRLDNTQDVDELMHDIENIYLKKSRV